jgi:O-antigen ligase
MPQRSRRSRAETSPPDAFLWLTVCALGCATLSIFDRGGNTDRAIWLIAFCAAVALSAVLARKFFVAPHSENLNLSSKAWLAALGVLALFAIFSALPIGLDAWLMLPGHARYKPVIESLASSSVAAASLPVTLAPDAGLQALVLLLSCSAIALSAIALPETMRFKLLVFFVVIALLQALLGVAQIAFQGASVFTVDYVGHVRAAGTFVNKNHLATLFALLVPFTALQASQALASTELRYDLRRLFFMLWSVITISMVLACAATLSRSGIAAVMAVLIVAVTVETTRAARRGQKRRRTLAMGAVALFALGAALGSSESFFAAIADSSASGSFAARLEMYRATIGGAVSLFPLGSGIGSYAVAFPAFQPQTLTGFVEHAHNDLLQLLFEAGLFGLVALLLMGVAAIGVARTWRNSAFNPTLGAYLLGSLGFALHANLDFPARIPALAVIATILFSFACSFRAAEPLPTKSRAPAPKSEALDHDGGSPDSLWPMPRATEASTSTDSADKPESRLP